MKHCPRCLTTKQDTEFYIERRRNKPPMLSGYCKVCMRAYLRPRNKKLYAQKRDAARQVRMQGIVFNLPGEIWVPMAGGYENDYSVSNLARVKSHKDGFAEHMMTASPKKSLGGYRTLSISKDGKHKTMYLHRLVGKAFVANPHNYPEINHKNGDKTNCHPSNLEWCTEKQNTAHAIHVLGNHGSINRTHDAKARALLPTKKCGGCKTVKDKSEFHKCKTYVDGLTHYCKTCNIKKSALSSKKKRLLDRLAKQVTHSKTSQDPE